MESSQAALNPTMREGMSPEEREIHLGFMRKALAMAELALNSSETPVGCVFVLDGTIIGRGMNATNRSYNGTRHAEFIALNDILSSKQHRPEVLKECDLYVTVEPCIMCASLLRQVGIRKVFFGAVNEKFGGTGGVLSLHKGNRVAGEEGKGTLEGDYEVSGGWLREEAIVLLRRFYVQENGRAPEPRSKKQRVLKLEVEPIVDEAVLMKKDAG